MAASKAIKGNSFALQKEKQADIESQTLTFPLKKELSGPPVSISIPSDSKVSGLSEKEKLKLFLDEIAANRKRNELVYGYKEGDDPEQINKRWGIEVSETLGFCKKNLNSTITRGTEGWAEFGITYDNKFF